MKKGTWTESCHREHEVLWEGEWLLAAAGSELGPCERMKVLTKNSMAGASENVLRDASGARTA